MLLAGRLKEVVLKTKRFSLQAARFFKTEAFFRFWGKCKALF